MLISWTVQVIILRGSPQLQSKPMQNVHLRKLSFIFATIDSQVKPEAMLLLALLQVWQEALSNRKIEPDMKNRTVPIAGEP